MKSLFPASLRAIFIVAALTASTTGMAATETHTQRSKTMLTYQSASIDGLEIFYREAGDRRNPTVLLLHGFPSSSRMYEKEEKSPCKCRGFSI
jgi:hypothetical protein